MKKKFVLVITIVLLFSLFSCSGDKYLKYNLYYVTGATMGETANSDPTLYINNVHIIKSDEKQNAENYCFVEEMLISVPNGQKKVKLHHIDAYNTYGFYNDEDGETYQINRNGEVRSYQSSKKTALSSPWISSDNAIEIARSYFVFFHGEEIVSQYLVSCNTPIEDKNMPMNAEDCFYWINFYNESEGYRWRSRFSVRIGTDGTVLNFTNSFIPEYTDKTIPVGFSDKVENAVRKNIKNDVQEISLKKDLLTVLSDGRLACGVKVTVISSSGSKSDCSLLIPIE